MSTNIQSTYKSLDTEEHIDIYFNRPIGYVWALFFKRLHVHPNVITIISIFLGMAAGAAWYYPDLKHTLLGIFLLVWANHYDSADGQLARMTGQKTRWGRMLDGFAGDLWFFSIYFFICLRLMPTWGIWIWVLCAISGFVCHGRQCTLADYYRNIHLYFLKGTEGSELDNFAQQRKLFHSLPWKGNFWWKMFLYNYGNYTRNQEQMTPWFQRFYAMIRQKYGDNLPVELRNEFRAASLPLMKYTNILTFNVRAITLYISMIVQRPWIYMVVEIVILSIVFFYMRQKHESMSRKFYEKYSKL